MSRPLTPGQWSEAEPILDRALDIATRDRDGFLDHACRGSSALRRRVELLVAAAEDRRFLQTGAGWNVIGALRTLGPDRVSPSRCPRRRIGPYRVLEEIGRGGMGLVFLAEHADGLWERRVALKLIRSDVPSVSLVRLFLHERRVLARLHHPDIARLLGGGATAEGYPYFVMELVKGLPITEYCERQGLETPARLDLILAACKGVQYAHDRNVVHRDLKPSNIHVTDEGGIKLLDFGVARILRPEVAPWGEADSNLEPRFLPLTPEYAAPELFRREPADPTSDIYSLGVVLYELLAGERPYEVHERTPGEVAWLTSPVRPMRLSDAVTRPASIRRCAMQSSLARTIDVMSISAIEGVRRLRRPLGRDIDRILAKALSDDRTLRYPSVDAFAHDIRAYRDGRPIQFSVEVDLTNTERCSDDIGLPSRPRWHRPPTRYAPVTALTLMAARRSRKARRPGPQRAQCPAAARLGEAAPDR